MQGEYLVGEVVDIIIDSLNRFQLHGWQMGRLEEELTNILTAYKETNAIALEKATRELNEVEDKLRRVKVCRGLGEIDEDVYHTTLAMLTEKRAEIEEKITETKQVISNSSLSPHDLLLTISKLSTLWLAAPPSDRQIIQKIAFPDGLFGRAY